MKNALYWTPRILTIVFILFLGLFALDSFEGEQSLLQKMGGFLIHLIPNFVLICTCFLVSEGNWFHPVYIREKFSRISKLNIVLFYSQS
jgi:hypothetical protein